MLGVADYGAFVAAVVIFLLIPGPGNLALITSTGKGATCGLILGDQVLMWLAVAGVAVLLAHFLAERLRANPTASHLMTRLAGMLLIGFGIRLGVGR